MPKIRRTLSERTAIETTIAELQRLQADDEIGSIACFVRTRGGAVHRFVAVQEPDIDTLMQEFVNAALEFSTPGAPKPAKAPAATLPAPKKVTKK